MTEQRPVEDPEAGWAPDPAADQPEAATQQTPTVDAELSPEPSIEPTPGPSVPASEPDAEPAPSSEAEETAVTAQPEEPAAPVADEPPTAVTEAPETAVDEPVEAAETAVIDTDETVVAEVPEPVAAPTVVVPVAVAPSAPTPSEPVATTAVLREPPADAIFRDAAAEETRLDALSVEQEKLAAERAARKQARDAALAVTAPPAPEPPAPVVVTKISTDKFFGSVGLFLLRIVVAAVFAIRGVNLLTDLPAAQELFAQTVIPEPALMSLVTGIACTLVALGLILGLLTRVAGLGAALIAGGALAFVQWGPTWSPFIAGRAGFLGELELVLAAVGLMFLFVGGGGWSLDRSFRSSRAKDRAERGL